MVYLARFTEDEVKSMVAFVRSLASEAEPIKVAGNPQRGQELYWGKGNCAACHLVMGRGGRLGPDLTRVGAQRSPASLRESLLKPAAVIVSGYTGVRAVRAAGRGATEGRGTYGAADRTSPGGG